MRTAIIMLLCCLGLSARAQFTFGRLASDVAVAPVSGNPEVVTNNLVGFWVKGQATNDTTVTDWSGNGNIGYWSNSPTWLKVTNDYALNFGGSAFVDFGTNSSLNLTGSYSVCGWVKTSTTTFSFLLDKTIGAAQPGYGSYIDNSPYYVYSRNNSVTVSGVIGPWNDGNWHHYAAVYNGTSFFIFRDGQPATNYLASVPLTTTAHLQMAARNGGTILTGAMMRWRLYNAVISTNNVNQIYTNELPRL